MGSVEGDGLEVGAQRDVLFEADEADDAGAGGDGAVGGAAEDLGDRVLDVEGGVERGAVDGDGPGRGCDGAVGEDAEQVGLVDDGAVALGDGPPAGRNGPTGAPA